MFCTSCLTFQEKLLRNTIEKNDVKSFHCHLDELERLPYGDEKMKVQIKERALCYAAYIGSNRMIETLVQEDIGKEHMQILLMRISEVEPHNE